MAKRKTRTRKRRTARRLPPRKKNGRFRKRK